jgi:hypothetical protein
MPMNNMECLKVITGMKSQIYKVRIRKVIAADNGLIILNWQIIKTEVLSVRCCNILQKIGEK